MEAEYTFRVTVVYKAKVIAPNEAAARRALEFHGENYLKCVSDGPTQSITLINCQPQESALLKGIIDRICHSCNRETVKLGIAQYAKACISGPEWKSGYVEEVENITGGTNETEKS